MNIPTFERSFAPYTLLWRQSFNTASRIRRLLAGAPSPRFPGAWLRRRAPPPPCLSMRGIFFFFRYAYCCPPHHPHGWARVAVRLVTYNCDPRIELQYLNHHARLDRPQPQPHSEGARAEPALLLRNLTSSLLSGRAALSPPILPSAHPGLRTPRRPTSRPPSRTPCCSHGASPCWRRRPAAA